VRWQKARNMCRHITRAKRGTERFENSSGPYARVSADKYGALHPELSKGD
jgi:hypothetical protein